MGSTFHSLHDHLVFSTKERRPVIQKEWRSRLHQYLGGTVRGLGGVAEAVGGIEDHVHLLISINTTREVAGLVRKLKKASPAWAAQNHKPGFAWQEGYGVFSVSWTHAQELRRSISTPSDSAPPSQNAGHPAADCSGRNSAPR